MRKATIAKTFVFQAAHQLPWHAGKCARLHGHTYRFEVWLTGSPDADGVIVDFDDIVRQVTPIIDERFDHRFLNDWLESPTAENIASSLFDLIEATGLPVSAVKLWETDTSWALVEA